MIYKNTSSKHIIRKVFRDLKPNDDNWIDDAVEWIGEALEHIGSASQLCQKKVVYSTSIGGPWQSSTKPNTRRKMNVKNKKGKK